MLSFLNKKPFFIGIDLSGGELKMAQLGRCGKGDISVISGAFEVCPQEIESGSAQWQKWMIDTIGTSMKSRRFRGKQVVAAMPPAEVFLDTLRVPDECIADGQQINLEDRKVQDALYAQIRHKLPSDLNDVMIKYLPTEAGQVIAVAIQRCKVDRNLAIYDRVGLNVRTIALWPMALMNTYACFFGRRESDLTAVVILIDINSNHTNLVICRHKQLLFARSIKIGNQLLDQEGGLKQLLLELTACKDRFSQLYPNCPIERQIFLSGQLVDREIYMKIAPKLDMPAQMGDCLTAVEISNPQQCGIDRRECQTSWASAFGLSLP